MARQITQITKAALILNEAQQKISELIGTNVLLSFEVETPYTLNATNVIAIVSQVANISVEQLTSKARFSEATYSRFVCYWLLRKYLGLTLKAIGDLFNRDHSTVIYGLDVIDNEPNNKDLQEILVQSEQQLIKIIRNEN